MKQKPVDKTIQPDGQQAQLHDVAPVQVIYADRVLNAGFGPVVSRLTLGIEVGVNTFTPITTLVIPTIALMEAMDAIQKTIIENDEMRTVIINGMDQVKAQLEKAKK
jgi:hypothetical protein